ncbi:hypothetical protein ACN9MZ_18435 [Pseudoduganella sp. S-14]|uniref:hypothetical protein n=1 Tax=Pseudoduganella sp. S-14 TaxID=3404065 RepID=UPI003CEDB062
MPFVVSRALCVATVACASLPAFAQQAPRISSRDEYRACLDQQEKLSPRLKLLNTKRDEHNADLKKLQDEAKAHVATQAALDLYDQAAVDAFNARLDELNQRGDALNARSEAFDKDMADYNSTVTALNQRCAGMVVSTRVHDSVLKLRAVNPRK